MEQIICPVSGARIQNSNQQMKKRTLFGADLNIFMFS